MSDRLLNMQGEDKADTYGGFGESKVRFMLAFQSV